MAVAVAVAVAVASVVSLASQSFWDNAPCPRLTAASIFVLQCRDPTGTGTGGPGCTVPDEQPAATRTTAPNGNGDGPPATPVTNLVLSGS